MSPHLNQIAAKLAQLEKADPECRCFGVDIHRYRLGPRLSAGDVTRIETSYAIGLPADYRAFLLELGNGGAGPGYGLQRFGFVSSVAEIPMATPKGPFREVQKTSVGTMSRQDLFDASGRKIDPFDVSFFDAMRNVAPDGSRGPAAPAQQFPLTGPIRASVAWSDFDPSIGTWTLAEYGCAMAAHLVLNGPFRGQVWFYDPNSDCFVPFCEMANIHYVDAEEPTISDFDAPFSFSDWYVHWLDHAIEQVGREY